MGRKSLAKNNLEKRELIIKEIQSTITEKIELEKKYPSIKFGQEFEKTKQELYALDKEITKFKLIVGDTEYFISEYFLNLRNQADLERELSKKQIDDHYDKHIQELHKIEKECKDKRTEEKYDEVIQQYEKDWEELNNCINIPEIDTSRWSRIKFNSMKKFSEIDLISRNYQSDLLGNQILAIKSIKTDLEKLLKKKTIEKKAVSVRICFMSILNLFNFYNFIIRHQEVILSA